MKHKSIFTTAIIICLLSGVVFAEKNHAEYKDWRLFCLLYTSDAAYNQEKSQECFVCHTTVQDSDYVFTMSVLQ